MLLAAIDFLGSIALADDALADDGPDGATVTLAGPARSDPAGHLLDGRDTDSTGCRSLRQAINTLQRILRELGDEPLLNAVQQAARSSDHQFVWDGLDRLEEARS